MLVLSRKENERIVIGGKIVITVCKIAPNKVRIGIEAPRELEVSRSELLSRPDWCDASENECNGVPMSHLKAQQLERCTHCPLCNQELLAAHAHEFV